MLLPSTLPSINKPDVGDRPRVIWQFPDSEVEFIPSAIIIAVSHVKMLSQRHMGFARIWLQSFRRGHGLFGERKPLRPMVGTEKIEAVIDSSQRTVGEEKVCVSRNRLFEKAGRCQ